MITYNKEWFKQINEKFNKAMHKFVGVSDKYESLSYFSVM